ncbi:MAG: cobalamin-dependent protein [Thermoplasmata archaeon]|nr:cobalamin-dependent protein [Thermoplasmata archaeon]
MTAQELYSQFVDLLQKEDKGKAVQLVLEKLESGELDILTLYSEILTPAQNGLVCWQDDSLCIWREHVRTSIVRTVLECCYPYVVKEIPKYRVANGEKVIIGCPSEEYHEIGARMVADYFTLLGFHVTFVGANTPQSEIMNAIAHVKPKIVGISVSNFYNLVAAGKIVGSLARIRKEEDLDFRIVVGGNAFRLNPKAHENIGADAVLQTFGDLKRYAGEVLQR